MNLEDKINALHNDLLKCRKLAVALSGGTDSTFLTLIAHRILGKDLHALTLRSPLSIDREICCATELCRDRGIDHRVLDVNPTDDADFRKNDLLRCYHCKKLLFARIREYADETGIDCIADGSTMSDMADYRPGTKALEELGILSPLKNSGFTREDITVLLKQSDVAIPFPFPNACLASRIPFGTAITGELLQTIARGEEILMAEGLYPHRLRHHGDTARIELNHKDSQLLMNDQGKRIKVLNALKALGFRYVAIDIEGIRSGSLNPPRKG